MKQNTTRKLTVSAILIALATVLSLIKIQLPVNIFGGSITLASMVPVILISLRYDVKWSLLSAVAFGALQILVGGFYAPPTPTFINFVLVVLLDYLIAFGVLGLAGAFGHLFKKPVVQIIGGSAIVVGLRFLCHFISGMLIWGSYAEQGQPIWLYSLTYNGSYMIPELIITVAAVVLLSQVILKQFLQKNKLQ